MRRQDQASRSGEPQVRLASTDPSRRGPPGLRAARWSTQVGDGERHNSSPRCDKGLISGSPYPPVRGSWTGRPAPTPPVHGSTPVTQDLDPGVSRPLRRTSHGSAEARAATIPSSISRQDPREPRLDLQDRVPQAGIAPVQRGDLRAGRRDLPEGAGHRGRGRDEVTQSCPVSVGRRSRTAVTMSVTAASVTSLKSRTASTETLRSRFIGAWASRSQNMPGGRRGYGRTPRRRRLAPRPLRAARSSAHRTGAPPASRPRSAAGRSPPASRSSAGVPTCASRRRRRCRSA